MEEMNVRERTLTVNKSRSCRDIPCCLIFVLFWAGMVTIASVALQRGDPLRLYHGFDSYGNVCGRKENPNIPNVTLSGMDMSDRPYLLYFDLTKTKLGKLFVNPLLNKVSPEVREEFKSSLANDDFQINEDRLALMICVKRCPDRFMLTAEQFRKYMEETGASVCTYNTVITAKTEQDTLLGSCPPFVLPTTPMLNRCVPLLGVASKKLKVVGDLLKRIDTEIFGFSRKMISDVHNSWKHLVIISLLAFVLSFFMMLCLGLVAQITTYVIGLVMLCASIFFTCWMWYVYYVERTNSTDISVELGLPSYEGSENTLLTIAIITTCVASIIICMILFLRKSIALMVAFFKEVGVAMATIPSMLVVPPLSLVCILGLVCAWLIISTYIYTASKPVATAFGTAVYTQPPYITYVWVYYVIGLFWGVQFLLAALEMTLAGAFADYYAVDEEAMLSLPLLKSFWRMIRYHLGSLAFGSLILAIARLLRYIIKLITREAQRNSNHSLVAKFIRKCFRCCIWCLEKFLNFFNRNVYIQIAAQGDSFCSATKNVFNILRQNPTHFIVISSIGRFFLFLAKLVVVILSFVAGYYILRLFHCDHIYEIAVPVVIGSVIAYVIAYVFFYVFKIGVDTFVVCYCFEKSFSNQMNGEASKEMQMIRKAISKNKGQDFKPSAAPLYPNMGQVLR
ncbi:choline transporter-like protein 1 isoform X3 [Montipora foliosa]|uniref:choline transporter-like protein 1 isoform X3 n=1 Tax=Montipora foliosa TaxID=591990 RepID=UPI0035F180BF